MKKIITSITLTLLLLGLNSANACTDFRVQAKDGTTLIARSMEFALDLHSNVRNSNRGREFNSMTPNGKPGLNWKAKYGYLYVDGLDHEYTVDGMNEKGLSFEFLYLPGQTTYQTLPTGKEKQGVLYMQFGDWVLSNFSSVEEVRSALSSIYVYQGFLPGMNNMVFPLHASIFDSTGKGIVVEFINGQMKIHDNIGVMTNSPTYDWHMSNLRNYLNLSPFSPNPITINGITYSATGQGAGSLGLPGDISPPSRFVKTAFLLKVAYTPNNAEDALSLAQHIINNVDIPAGLAQSMVNGKVSVETTQWVVFKDLTHKMFYYRSYDNMTLHSIDMNKLNFADSTPKFKLPLASKAYVLDETKNLLTNK